MNAVVLGFDVGGTGARGVIGHSGDVLAREVPLQRGPSGVDGAATAAVLASLAAGLLGVDPPPVAAVAVGCAGALDLGADLRVHVPPAMARATGAPLIVITSDMVTSFLGGLGGEPGVVLAVGTGAVAVGSDLRGEWRRVDGWGDIVGDVGGGAWIGRAGLTAALRAHDGRPGGSALLRAELLRRFAGPAALVADLHSRTDRAGTLAGFAPVVLAAAADGDPAAVRIRAQACRHLAGTAAAARPPALFPASTVLTGALFTAHGEFRDSLRAELPGELMVREASGTACDGAVRLAEAAIAGRLPAGVDRWATLHR